MPHILSIFLLILSIICKRAAAIFKCSPLDGALDTYSFTHGSDNGIVCAKGTGQEDVVFFIEKMSTAGYRKLAVGTAKYSTSDKLHHGFIYRLSPTGPKQPITIKASTGYMELKVNDSETILWNLRPDGINWIPANLQQIPGCAPENPQINMNIANPVRHYGILCAMAADPAVGFSALYGFGVSPPDAYGSSEHFFYLGQTPTPITASEPLGFTATMMGMCYQADCTKCRVKGWVSLKLST